MGMWRGFGGNAGRWDGFGAVFGGDDVLFCINMLRRFFYAYFGAKMRVLGTCTYSGKHLTLQR